MRVFSCNKRAARPTGNTTGALPRAFAYLVQHACWNSCAHKLFPKTVQLSILFQKTSHCQQATSAAQCGWTERQSGAPELGKLKVVSASSHYIISQHHHAHKIFTENKFTSTNLMLDCRKDISRSCWVVGRVYLGTVARLHLQEQLKEVAFLA